MSSKKVVRAYTGNDECSRNLRRKEAVGANVEVLKSIPVEACMTFSQATLEFRDDKICKGRPYIHLDEGKVTKVYAVGDNLPFGVILAQFPQDGAPLISMDWDLSNEEIGNLVKKGIFGSNFDIDPNGNNPKPKDSVKIPPLFTDVEWDRIPVTANVRAMESDGVPVLSIDICNPYDLKTNSRVSGYDDISQYFQPQEFYAEGQNYDKSKYFVSLSKEDTIGAEVQPVLEELTEEQASNIIRAEKVKSLEEQEEEKLRAMMAHEISMRTELIIDETQVDDSNKLVDSLEAPSSEAEAETADDEAFSDEMLADMHLIETDTTAERAKAEAKIGAISSGMIQATEDIKNAEAEEQRQKAQISEAMNEGQNVIDREKAQSGGVSGPTVQ